MPHTSFVAHYDYIISGAGAAGLSLLTRIIASGKFTDKKILLVDKDAKTANDRTWCFWEKERGFFESLVYKSWPSLWVHGSEYSTLIDIAPYRYKMIRGIDFYNHCFALITGQKNVTILYGTVQDLQSDGKGAFLIIDNQKYTADYIFNSILFQKPIVSKKEFYLLQHFKGWVIETDAIAFIEHEATLMDFRILQDRGTAFVYVMPFSASKALVEFTMFSDKLLEQAEYDKQLQTYISNQLGCPSYKIISAEFGVIPMTNYQFPASNNCIINIGTAGGQTKASTGYTFMSIQKKTAAIADDLLNDRKPSSLHPPAKYQFYDSVLLNVLATGKLGGEKIFTSLFRKNDPSRIFKFLDNDSTLLQDLTLISSLPTIPFLKAGLQELF